PRRNDLNEKTAGKFWHYMTGWTRAALGSGTPVLVFGPGGERWIRPPLSALPLQRSEHRLCHYGLRFDPTALNTSGRSIVAASHPVRSLSRCSMICSR
ncbi:MAG: hypothetical protein MK316_12900, partial [Pseudomonadales bacterium]|nr:hypothetical protein [Pseudomonadales bacterium]